MKDKFNGSQDTGPALPAVVKERGCEGLNQEEFLFNCFWVFFIEEQSVTLCQFLVYISVSQSCIHITHIHFHIFSLTVIT